MTTYGTAVTETGPGYPRRMESQASQWFLRTRLIQAFIWHEDEAGTVLLGPSGIGKSTLIQQIRQTAGDAANFVELTEPCEPVETEAHTPLFVYLDPAEDCGEEPLARLIAQAVSRQVYLVATFQRQLPPDIQQSIQDGALRVIDREAFRFDAEERRKQPGLAAQIDRRLDLPED